MNRRCRAVPRAVLESGSESASRRTSASAKQNRFWIFARDIQKRRSKRGQKWPKMARIFDVKIFCDTQSRPCLPKLRWRTSGHAWAAPVAAGAAPWIRSGRWRCPEIRPREVGPKKWKNRVKKHTACAMTQK